LVEIYWPHITGGWRRLHKEELQDLYFSPDVTVFKSRRMRKAGHVARTGDRCVQGLVGRPEGKRPLGNLGVDGRIILKWICKKWDGGMDWIDVAQDRDRWRTAVNVVKNVWVP